MLQRAAACRLQRARPFHSFTHIVAHLARALYMQVFDGWVVTGTGAAVACAAIVLCAAAGMAMTTPLGWVA